MEKLLDIAFQVLKPYASGIYILLVALAALAIFSWHQFLKLDRHKYDREQHTLEMERERDQAKLLRQELERSYPEKNVQQRSGNERRAPRQLRSRVLVVEDNSEMQLIIQAMLSKCLQSPDVKIKATTSEAVEEIKNFAPELLILDMNLGQHSGLDILSYLRLAMPDLPVLVYTGYQEQLLRVQELRTMAGISNLTVLQKGADLDAFLQMVPHLFRRRASDKVSDKRSQRPVCGEGRERRNRPLDRRRQLNYGRLVCVDRQNSRTEA